MNTNFNRTFVSDPDLLPEIEDFILDAIKGLKISDLKRNNIELAIAEAAANSILHGNKSDKNKKVHIKLNIDEYQILISFSDEGEGFTLGEVPDPTIPENILKGSGRGIHIMKSLADDYEYKFSDKGTELVLTFKL